MNEDDKSDASRPPEKDIRDLIQEGIDAANRGDVIDWNPQEIKEEGRRRLAARGDEA